MSKHASLVNAFVDLGAGKQISTQTGSLAAAPSAADGGDAERELKSASAIRSGATTNEVYIAGWEHRNRAIHGDEVVVQVLPRAAWARPVQRLVDEGSSSGGGKQDEAGAGSGTEDGKQQAGGAAADKRDPIPTGRVVGVLSRRWRPLVATIQLEDVQAGHAQKYTLCVPMDPRVPKIRIQVCLLDLVLIISAPSLTVLLPSSLCANRRPVSWLLWPTTVCWCTWTTGPKTLATLWATT